MLSRGHVSCRHSPQLPLESGEVHVGLGALEMLFRNLQFPNRVPFTEKKCLGAIALSKMKQRPAADYTKLAPLTLRKWTYAVG